MKFAIDIGHNVNFDTGSVGIKSEDTLNMEVGTRVINKLKALGYSVVACKPQHASSLVDSLKQRTSTANANDVDYFVSIHFNCGGGNGTEVYAASQKGKDLAEKVLKEIVNLGFTNRGVKDGSWLYVIKHTVAPAILIECAFVDSQKDMNLYNADSMAKAIVKGLTGQSVDDNASDPQILKLQKTLNRLQIKDSDGKALVEDGVSGAKTISAVKKFQSIVGITEDGIAGTATWDKINTILSKPVLSVGKGTVEAIRYVQWRVGTAIDGVYGANTKNLVIGFQKKNGLTADGIVGPLTWTKLIG